MTEQKKKSSRKLLWGLLFLGALVALQVSPWGRFLTLANIQENLDTYRKHFHLHPVASISTFTALYILLAAVSFPGASLMTVLGGALYGVLLGSLICNFAASIGAIFPFFASRLFFRDFVKEKWKKEAQKMNQELVDHGPLYLLSLRLNPVVPFWLLNLLMGLTQMKLPSYFLLSFVGMIPGAALYANAGSELVKIKSASDILQPSIALALFLLSIFPVAVRFLIKRKIQARKFLFVMAMSVPVNDKLLWKEVKFNKIPPNTVSSSMDGLRISVDKSSSPLIYKLKEPISISRIKAQIEWKGPLPKSNGAFGEDSLLRIGLVSPGKNTLSGPKKWFAANWVLELFKLAPKNSGIDRIYFFNLDSNSQLLGKSRVHPKSDYMQEKVVQIVSPSTSVLNLDYQLEKPTPTVAIWLSSDGDDTQTKFEVWIKQLSLEF